MRRLRQDERGFTLPEVLVTMLMMIVVLFALYSMFDMGIRVFAFGNDKLEATENARLGLEKMQREIRAAYSIDKANSKNYRFFSVSSTTQTNSTPTNAPASNNTFTSPAAQITFGNDRDGNTKVQCVSASACEYITYRLNDGALVRNNTITYYSSSAGDQPVVGNVNGLTFTPLKSGGGAPANEAEIDVIQVRLEISVPGDPPRTQTLTTMVNLRNKAQ